MYRILRVFNKFLMRKTRALRWRFPLSATYQEHALNPDVCTVCRTHMKCWNLLKETAFVLWEEASHRKQWQFRWCPPLKWTENGARIHGRTLHLQIQVSCDSGSRGMCLCCTHPFANLAISHIRQIFENKRWVAEHENLTTEIAWTMGAVLAWTTSSRQRNKALLTGRPKIKALRWWLLIATLVLILVLGVVWKYYSVSWLELGDICICLWQRLCKSALF